MAYVWLLSVVWLNKKYWTTMQLERDVQLDAYILPAVWTYFSNATYFNISILGSQWP